MGRRLAGYANPSRAHSTIDMVRVEGRGCATHSDNGVGPYVHLCPVCLPVASMSFGLVTGGVSGRSSAHQSPSAARSSGATTRQGMVAPPRMWYCWLIPGSTACRDILALRGDVVVVGGVALDPADVDNRASCITPRQRLWKVVHHQEHAVRSRRRGDAIRLCLHRVDVAGGGADVDGPPVDRKDRTARRVAPAHRSGRAVHHGHGALAAAGVDGAAGHDWGRRGRLCVLGPARGPNSRHRRWCRAVRGRRFAPIG
jgi:hypothetical protein